MMEKLYQLFQNPTESSNNVVIFALTFFFTLTIILTFLKKRYYSRKFHVLYSVEGVISVLVPVVAPMFMKFVHQEMLAEDPPLKGLGIYALFPMTYCLSLGLIITLIAASMIAKQNSKVRKELVETFYVETGLMGVGMAHTLFGSIFFPMTATVYLVSFSRIHPIPFPFSLIGLAPFVCMFLIIAKWYKVVGVFALKIFGVEVVKEFSL